jgi:putative transposase
MARETLPSVKMILESDKDWLQEIVKKTVQECLEAEMTNTLNAAKGERNKGRCGYRAGYYDRNLITRVGKLEIRVPQDREGRFSTELFERYQRSEKALVSSLIEMYVQGVSTRKVKAITEELCGHEFSASAVSRVNKTLDENLKSFAERPLEEAYPYLLLDARYERVRENGVVHRRAVLIAIGINTNGQRNILAVELANRESTMSWSNFLERLIKRGLSGVEFVVSDHHEGLKSAITQKLTSALWQRCYVHFLRNAMEHLPRNADEDCLRELRSIYDQLTLEKAKVELAIWLKKWQLKCLKFCDWVEENIEETFSFFRLPLSHRKHLRSSNLIERVNEEIKRRTHIVRVFPNEESCLRLIRALCVEIHEEWQESSRYLNMQLLQEQKKINRREAA